MSIRVTLADGTPLGKSLPQGEENRSKIRVTLPPPAPEPVPDVESSIPSPPPARVMAFWHHDEDAHLTSRPWRHMESPNEQAIREQAERDGSWAGL
jgi:hypothetical protein